MGGFAEVYRNHHDWIAIDSPHRKTDRFTLLWRLKRPRVVRQSDRIRHFWKSPTQRYTEPHNSASLAQERALKHVQRLTQLACLREFPVWRQLVYYLGEQF